jgi:hypothetical protein
VEPAARGEGPDPGVPASMHATRARAVQLRTVAQQSHGDFSATMGLSPAARATASMFRMIGHYEITRDGDVISVWSTPEFNLEAAQQYAQDMLELIAQMPPKFGTLVAFDAPPVIGPEVEEAMRRSARQRAERGLVAVAFVTGSLDGIEIARAQWERVYDGSGIAFLLFREAAPARAWLQEQIDRAR